MCSSGKEHQGDIGIWVRTLIVWLYSTMQDASNTEKEAVVIALHRKPLSEDEPFLTAKGIERLVDLCVAQFVTSCLLNLFLASPINP